MGSGPPTYNADDAFDDAASALTHHEHGGGARHAKGAPQVGLQDVDPVLIAHAWHETVSGYASIVDHDVETTQGLCGADERLAAGVGADVCLHDFRAPVWTLLLDLVQHAVWNAVVVGENDCVFVASDQLAAAVGDL